MSEPLHILNVYGPYREREFFWNNALRGGLLNLPYLVLGGDLNLTLHSSKIWGSKATLDPLSYHFISLFETAGLVDVAPLVTGPTWRNGWYSILDIGKRLDIFMVADHLVPLLPQDRVWTRTSEIFDHYPICLDWFEVGK